MDWQVFDEPQCEEFFLPEDCESLEEEESDLFSWLCPMMAILA